MSSKNGPQTDRMLSVSTNEPEEKSTRRQRLRLWANDFKKRAKLTLHNKETGEYLTRTPSSWAKIGAFYFILYSCLAAFFAVCLTVFLVTIPSIEEGPRFSNIITENLGVGIAPRPTKKVSISYVRGGDLTQQHRDNTKKIENALYRAGYSTDEQDSLLPIQMKHCNGASFGTPQEPCVFFITNRIFNFKPGTALSWQCDYLSGNLLEKNSTLILYPSRIEPERFSFGRNDSFQSPFFVGHFDLRRSYKMREAVEGLFECFFVPVDASVEIDIKKQEFKIEYH